MVVWPKSRLALKAGESLEEAHLERKALVNQANEGELTWSDSLKYVLSIFSHKNLFMFKTALSSMLSSYIKAEHATFS